MKEILLMVGVVLLIGIFKASTAVDSSQGPAGSSLTSFYTSSLHYTGEGMRHWYEDEGGFGNITHIPYRQLDCSGCHVTSCDQCHAEKTGEKICFSEKKAKDMNTCIPCHSREGLAFKIDKERGQPDVHIRAGMVCSDCHYRSDVHGDGRFRQSMRHPKGVRASCEECHIQQEMSSPEFIADSPSHKAHGDRLACSACHVRSTVSCYNCHFDRYLETGERKGNFLPMKDWLLLINHEGKVTAGNVQTLVFRNQRFVAYAPYHTHSISAEGRQCDDCHANAAVKAIREGRKIRLVEFENGSQTTWKGVVPLVEGKLDWIFLSRTEKGWEPIRDASPPVEQYVGYGTPLSAAQMESLSRKRVP